jgi:hypothetical protein
MKFIPKPLLTSSDYGILVMNEKRPKLLFFSIVLILGFSFNVFAGSSIKIQVKDFPNNWPFTVSEGILRCDKQAIIFVSNGETYAVNGIARAIGIKKGWKEIDKIWKEDPKIRNLKMSLSPIIDRGLDLCK